MTDLQKLESQGDALAQYDRGVMYYYGRGVLEDDAEAVRWWRLAAEQGIAHAQEMLGHID
jgi:TPR repeat protein